MKRIKYSVSGGTAPVTVTLTPGTYQNIHNSVPANGYFDVPDNLVDYVIQAIDSSDPVCYIEKERNECVICPDGYIDNNGECIKYEYDTATTNLPFSVLVEATDIAYSNFGTLIFDSFNLDGTGVYFKIPYVNSYWHNQLLTTVDGPMNRSGVWVTTERDNQDIRFSYCIDIVDTKTYYVGVGCDNWSKIYLNGVKILEQDRTAIASMLNITGSNADRVPFKYWFIYPIELTSGKNIITVEGHNESSVAGVGVEIYDATKLEIINASSDLDLGSQLLFRSSDLIGEDCEYDYAPVGGVYGYTCASGFIFNPCEGGDCIKVSKLPCESALDEGYGFLYNWYALTDARKITSDDNWIVPAPSDFNTLMAYIGSTAGQKLRESGYTNWNTGGIEGTNTSNFNLRGHGYRTNAGFSELKESGHLMTSENYSAPSTSYYYINKYAGSWWYSNVTKYYGMGCRLVRTSTDLSDGETGVYIGNDGKVYPTICIGTQEWLAHGLSETKYRNDDWIAGYDGGVYTPISNSAWTNLVTGALCAYNDNVSGV